ncbi:putative restriction endonuclease [Actinomycetospora succinea]|uniref:Putative restriction endonuclease n=1 Tax=Actinomycetospora succinea TaxID=663603 RepID=A0A4R6V993_9PSEU|nr:Uma2 family endonuclease [Actinomycetospora succinea]TDQ55769.1 putative restriction endonuclease [Actinomycetospora succinea]
MAAPEPQIDPFAHDGPWTEADVLALPVDRHVELLDGSLLVSPTSSNRHQWLSSRLWVALNEAAPPDMRALEAVNIRVGTDRLLIPDLAVIRQPDMSALVTDALAVRLVLEIVSPSNAFMDRAVKPQLYAQAGIPVHVRVELGTDEPVGHVLALDETGAYRETTSGTTITLDRPYPVTIDLAALAR